MDVVGFGDGAVEGEPLGVCDGAFVGFSEGLEVVGIMVGDEVVGGKVGEVVEGCTLGFVVDGDVVGTAVGEVEQRFAASSDLSGQ